MQFDLVDRGHDSGFTLEPVEVHWREIAHTDRPDEPLIAHRDHRAPGLHILVDSRQRPVDEIEIDAVETQIGERLLEPPPRGIRPVVSAPQLDRKSVG